MGLLDDVIGDLAGGTAGGGSPVQGILAGLLGGQGNAGGQGGLPGMIGNFERAGLGAIAQSWVGNGPNQPVSPDQLRSVFGENQVQTMASQTGMAPNDLLSQLAQHLPGLIDRMTPGGAMPGGQQAVPGVRLGVGRHHQRLMTTAIVTGATGGIGRWIALGLARAGHDVVLLGRDRTRGAAAMDWIAGLVPAAALAFEEVDLASQADTAACGDRLAACHERVAVLVNNAGMFTATRHLTAEGHDAVLAVNHLAPHVLTQRLLDPLRRGVPSRIVNVGSSTSDRARIDPDNLALRRWSMVRAYSQSKLAMMMTTFVLARHLAGSGVTANVVHPGTVATGLIRAGGPIGLAWRAMAPWLLTEEQGADTPLFACVAAELAGTSGAYFKRRRAVAPNRLALDAALGERVWAATERLAGGSVGGPAAAGGSLPARHPHAAG